MITTTASSLLARLLSYALLAGGAAFNAGNGVQVIENLGTGTGPASESRVAASDELRVAAAWCVASGEQVGVYLRRRTNLVWDAAASQVAGETSINPRDLSLVHDSTGALHLVWTDLEGERRGVFYAALDSELNLLKGPIALNTGATADADYPQIAWDDSFGALIVWQSAQSGRYSIEALRLDPVSLDSTTLITPSGANRMTLSPQIVAMNPPTIAWHEVLDASAELRLARWNGASAWTPWSPEGLSEIASLASQPVVRLDGTGAPVLCWSEDGADGFSSIRVARANPSGDISLDQPRGDHRQPQLVVRADGSASVAWQVFSGEGQSIEAAESAWSGEAAPHARISPPTHRFASDPSQDGAGEWSVVVWTDDLLDGGTGAVGFAEIHWADR